MEEDAWVNEEEAVQAQSEDDVELGEDQQEQAEKAYGYYPQENKKDSIFTLFRHILGIKDSSKVGNLKDPELGRLGLSVRGCQYLGLIGDKLNNNDFADFFKKEAEIALATSASRNGWFTELIVSQKNFRTRTVQAVKPNTPRKPFLGKIGKQNEQQ